MKTLLLTLSGLVITLGSIAQTPITRTDYETTIGTNFQYRGTDLVSQGEGGENATWDFSGLTNQISTNYEIVDTTGLLGVELFIDPNLVWSRLVGAEVYDYYNITDEKVQSVGTYAYDDSYYNYSNPITLVEFPIDISDAYSDDYEFNYDLLVVTGVATGTIDYQVDGFGTLIMPWGTISNAYRVKYLVEQTEVYDSGQGEQNGSYSGTNYSWFAPGYPGELVRITDGVTFINGQEVPSQFTQYLAEFTMSIGEAETLDLKNFEVFPNPAKDKVTVRFDWTEAEKLSLKVYDIQGRVMIQDNLPNQGRGQVLETIDVSALPAGYYLLVIESSTGVKSQKISKLR